MTTPSNKSPMAVTTDLDVYAHRVASGNWPMITKELDEHGGGLLPRLLTREECAAGQPVAVVEVAELLTP